MIVHSLLAFGQSVSLGLFSDIEVVGVVAGIAYIVAKGQYRCIIIMQNWAPMFLLWPGWPQSVARILDPGNSRENQLEFFSLDHEK